MAAVQSACRMGLSALSIPLASIDKLSPTLTAPKSVAVAGTNNALRKFAIVIFLVSALSTIGNTADSVAACKLLNSDILDISIP